LSGQRRHRRSAQRWASQSRERWDRHEAGIRRSELCSLGHAVGDATRRRLWRAERGARRL